MAVKCTTSVVMEHLVTTLDYAPRLYTVKVNTFETLFPSFTVMVRHTGCPCCWSLYKVQALPFTVGIPAKGSIGMDHSSDQGDEVSTHAGASDTPPHSMESVHRS